MFQKILIRLNVLSRRYFSITNLRFQSVEQLKDKPKKYTESPAFKYQAWENFRMKPQEPTVPPYNTFIIKSSIAIFLVYFAFLREPNHIDEMLSRDLFEIMPELELTMLELDIKNLEERGMPVDDLKKKLADLKRLEEEKLKQETSTNQ